ncbi:hypothetical protein GT50_02805 [Geobacillus stearothermophilus 10]|nr:hypothetical protein GT50_02805 [Geobacillus stearothermophilus 10]
MTAGAAEGLRLVFQYLSYKGARRVLVLGPQYSIVFQNITLAGLEFQELFGDPNHGFLPSVEVIRDAIRRTGADVIFMTQPNNPSGTQYSEEELGRIVDEAKATGAWVVFEKIGSDIALGSSAFQNFSSVFEKYDAWDSVFVVDSFSKRRPVSGFRLGYVLAAPSFLEFVVERRFGDCPPLVARDGFLRDLLYSAAIHVRTLGRENDSMNYLRSVINSMPVDIKDEILAVAQNELHRHEQELREMYNTIWENREFLFSTMRNYLIGYTALDDGSNFLASFRVPQHLSDERTFAVKLFEQERLASYPLGCFTADPEIARKFSKNGQIWLRISCGIEPKIFKEIVFRLCRFLEKSALTK